MQSSLSVGVSILQRSPPLQCEPFIVIEMMAAESIDENLYLLVTLSL